MIGVYWSHDVLLRITGKNVGMLLDSNGISQNKAVTWCWVPEWRYWKISEIAIGTGYGGNK